MRRPPGRCFLSACDGGAIVGLTEIVAVYAALLSTFIFIWNVKRERPSYKVELIQGVDLIDGKSELGVFVFIMNPSSQTVHIASMSLVYQYRDVSLADRIEHFLKFKRLPIRIGWVHSHIAVKDLDTKLPTSLESQKSHSIFMPQKILDRELSDAVKPIISVEVQDALWRRKYSKNLKVDLSRSALDEASV